MNLSDETKVNCMQTRAIKSVKINFVDNIGRRLVGYIDSVSGKRSSKHAVVVIPGYAETKRDYLSTAYYLACNGFLVFRFDCPNQLGESDGQVLYFKPSDVEIGLNAAIDHIELSCAVNKIGVIASSLSGRMVFKSAYYDKRIAYIIALTSIVDLRKTLFTLYKEDLVAEYKKGSRWGALDILGFEVKDDFINEVISKKYEDLNTTIDDVKKLRIPIAFIAAGNDAWVDCDDVKKVFNKAGHKGSKLIKMDSAMHQIQENPRLAQKVVIQMVSLCSEYSGGVLKDGESVKIPPISDIVKENRKEITDLKSYFTFTKKEEKDFWADYLSKFYVVMKSKDYQDLLSLILQLLGELKSGDKILDAGCGNGHFGAWLLCNIKDYVTQGKYDITVNYTGVDFAEKAINDAKEMHLNLIKQFDTKNTVKNKLRLHYVVADLEENLNFTENYFDKICCSLVISYLTDFEKALRSLYSVLRPKGKIVVTSLKPYSDLSMIYKNYLDQETNLQEIMEGRKLLSSAGKIRHKEKKGYYHFFDECELERLLIKVGFKNIKCCRSFGNQANVAVAEK